MPHYDYQCKECAEVFEKEHPMDNKDPVECPVCGTHLTHKIILRAPAIYVYWKNAAASSNASVPKFMRGTKSKSADSAQDYGGV